MGERGVRNAEVEGSNPLPSTMNIPGDYTAPDEVGAYGGVRGQR